LRLSRARWRVSAAFRRRCCSSSFCQHSSPSRPFSSRFCRTLLYLRLYSPLLSLYLTHRFSRHRPALEYLNLERSTDSDGVEFDDEFLHDRYLSRHDETHRRVRYLLRVVRWVMICCCICGFVKVFKQLSCTRSGMKDVEKRQARIEGHLIYTLVVHTVL
jgi:hypothetical protein